MLLGRLFPRDIRERVFEPAFGDLLHDWLTRPAGRARVPFGIRAMAMCLTTLVAAFPDFFVRRRRVTRFGRVTLGVMTALAVIVLLVLMWASRPASVRY